MPKSAIITAAHSSDRDEREQLIDEARLLLAERGLVLHLHVREVLHASLDRGVDRVDAAPRSAPSTNTNESS